MIKVSLVNSVSSSIIHNTFLLLFDYLIDSFVLFFTPVAVLAVFILSSIFLAASDVILIHIFIFFIYPEKWPHYCGRGNFHPFSLLKIDPWCFLSIEVFVSEVIRSSRTSLIAETSWGRSLGCSNVIVIAVREVRTYSHSITFLDGLVILETFSMGIIDTGSKSIIIVNETVILIHSSILTRKLL